MRICVGEQSAQAGQSAFNLDPVGRARAGRHRVRWQGVRTPQARACKNEQRRQRARGRPDRVRSALTKWVSVIGAKKSSFHAAFLKIASGQLNTDLGSNVKKKIAPIPYPVSPDGNSTEPNS